MASDVHAPLPGDERLAFDAGHATTAPPARRGVGRRLVRWLKLPAAVLILGWVGRELYRQLAAADLGDVRLTGGTVAYGAVSVLCVLVVYGALVTNQRHLLRVFAGVRMPWRPMMAAAWVPLAGKYVPGKVAAIAGAVVLLRRCGVSTGAALSVFVVLDALPLLLGAVLAASLLLDPRWAQLVPGMDGAAGWAVFAAVLAGGLVVVHPGVFTWIVNRALRLLRRPELPGRPRFADYVVPLIWASVQWIGNAAAVWFMARALAPAGTAPGVADFPVVVGITAVVMCLSYFSAVVTPGGIGAREGVMLVMLARIMPDPTAAAVVIAMRLAHTAAELLLCGVGFWMLRHLPAAGVTPDTQPNSVS